MYARQSPLPRPLRLPRNYSGNAFSAEEIPTTGTAPTQEENPPMPESTPSEVPTAEAPPEEAATRASPAAKLFPTPGFKLDLGRFFGKERGLGIGFEELLIIGMILLISGNDKGDDLLLLLLLLLFIQ